MTSVPAASQRIGDVAVAVAAQSTLPLVQVRLQLHPPTDDQVGVRSVAAAGLLDTDVRGRTLRDALDEHGATAATSAGVDGVLLTLAAPAGAWRQMLDLLAAVPEAQIRGGADTARAALATVRAEAASRQALPETQARAAMFAALYPASSAYRVEHPTPEQLPDNVARRALDWASRSSGSTLVLVGALDVDAVLAAAKGFDRGRASAETVDVGVPRGHWVSVPRAGSVQTCVRAAARVPGPGEQGRRAAEILQEVLGGASSRLVRRLREEHGWSYHPGSVLVDLRHDHRIEIEVDVATEYSRDAFGVLAAVLADLRETPLENDELETARRAIGTQWARTLDSQAALADALLQDPQAAADPRPELAAVTADDVLRMARQCLDPSVVVGAAVGEAPAADAAVAALT